MLGYWAMGSAEDGHDTHDDHDDCNDNGDDRPVDEKFSHGGLPLLWFGLGFGFRLCFRLLCRPGLCLSPRNKRLRVHHHAFPYLLCPFRDHLFPCLRPSSMTQSWPNHCPTLTGLIATLFSGLTTATRYLPWTSVTARWGMTSAAFLDPHLCADPAELPGPEEVLRVREDGGHPDGTGSHIHLAVAKATSPLWG